MTDNAAHRRVRAPVSTNGRRLFIARHGETVFNAHLRVQGNDGHTPLTRAGFHQAEAMGEQLAVWFTANGEPLPPDLQLVASDTGRTLQTLAVMAEFLHLDWHQAVQDRRLAELDVGDWVGQWYRDLIAKNGEFIHAEQALFTKTGAGGESTADIVVRLDDWLAGQAFDRDMLIVSHGITSRVLRGLLTGADDLEEFSAPALPALPQGSMVMIRDGIEELIVQGSGHIRRL